MIVLSREELAPIIDEAKLAPSVHNIQPSRWRLTDGAVSLLGDTQRSIPVADPEWRDWRLSHGAAFEGLAISLAQRGLQVAQFELENSQPRAETGAFVPIARFSIASLDRRSPSDPTGSRTSWRGSFEPINAETELKLDLLAAAREDLVLVRSRGEIANVARLTDRAGLHFLRDKSHRNELLNWMRLRKSDESYLRDGLNAEAMCLGSLEAWGAGLALGPLFRALDGIGLAALLVSERAKTQSAAAIALFHRPKGEDAFIAGRAFYRAWLDMERRGLKGCPLSVLADWPESRTLLEARCGIAEDRQIVSAFRIGEPAGVPRTRHERLPLAELLL